MGDLEARLQARTKRTLPANWQEGRKCPECGSDATRPKCFYELGPSCPRHDPDEYEPSPYVTVPDEDCAEAAAEITRLTEAMRLQMQTRHNAEREAKQWFEEAQQRSAEITRLREQVAAMDKALGEIADAPDLAVAREEAAWNFREIARAALQEQQP